MGHLLLFNHSFPKVYVTELHSSSAVILYSLKLWHSEAYEVNRINLTGCLLIQGHGHYFKVIKYMKTFSLFSAAFP